MNLSKGSRQPAGLIREQRGVEVAALRLLGKPHVASHARRLRPLEEREQRLEGHLGLEELVVVVADTLGEIRGERHLRISDELDVLADGLLHEGEHPLDDLLAARPLVVRAHLGGSDLDEAWHGGLPWRGVLTWLSPSYRSRARWASAVRRGNGGRGRPSAREGAPARRWASAGTRPVSASRLAHRHDLEQVAVGVLEVEAAAAP